VSSALIGHTGFVGGNLDRQGSFTARYNSKNIDEICGKSFESLVVSGIQARKWWANQNPAEDWGLIKRLLDSLKTVRARRAVLISTIDVYAHPAEVDERNPVIADERNAYGIHRYMAEQAVRAMFPDCCIVRLPGLFGDGLKKNVLFDLLNKNLLDSINPASRFQYYCLDRLWNDVQRCLDARLPLVNFATEPVSTATILKRFFPALAVGASPVPPAAYDVRSRHDVALGGEGGYLYGSEQVLEDMSGFIDRVRGIP
jgi:hypothetical protein